MAEEKRDSFSLQVLQLLDAALVFIGLWGAAQAWNLGLNEWFIKWTQGRAGAPVGTMVDVLFLAVPFLPLILEVSGFYQRAGLQRKGVAFLRLLQGFVIFVVAFSILVTLLKLTPHRPTLVIGLSLGLVLIWFREAALFAFYQKQHASSDRRMRVLMAGKAEACEAWWHEQGESFHQRYSLHGKFDVSAQSVQELSELLKETSAERVVFIVPDCPFERVTAAIEECEIQGVEVFLSADFVRARIAQPSFDSLGGTPMLVLRSTPSLSWSLLGKTLMDRVGAAVILLLAGLPMLAVAIGIKLSDKGPVFFKQDRAGRYGQPFKMWKFRTMVVDAEAKLAELKEQAGNQMDGPVFKLDHDPRIFPFGRFLRKFSIDELPQLFNVLMGDMSLVGPRPMAMYELPEIEKSEHRRKLSVRPGITCIWQVSGRNEITNFDDWVKLDLQYIDNWSLWLDIKILLQTIPAVLLAKGAK